MKLVNLSKLNICIDNIDVVAVVTKFHALFCGCMSASSVFLFLLKLVAVDTYRQALAVHHTQYLVNLSHEV